MHRVLREPIRKTLVMGIVNATPDSFYDGGRHNAPDQAIAHGKQLLEDGADILDIGGESSRPGAARVSPDEERRRVLPVIEGLAETGACLSVDTCHAATARAALEQGAHIVNDITALRGDPEMAGVLADSGCTVVLMHMQGTPQTMQKDPRYDDVVDDICAFFEERMAFAASQGIAEERLWLDPGFGFGKTAGHNLEMMRRIGEFRRFGRPVLLGSSNKATIGKVLDLPAEERREGTAATVAIAVWQGIEAVRVHDVRAMARVARMTEAIRGERAEA